VSSLVRLCAVDEVSEGEPRRVVVDGYPPLAVYQVGDDYFVTADTCTHGMASLCEGYQDGEEIECPYHGGAFNIKSGEPLAFPCTEPLETVPVELADNALWVESRASA
jgi:nitrite reductase/ring-hydroxylating ferredoxin subunit